MCAVRGPDCTRTPVEAHHRLLRSQGGNQRPDLAITACPTCHHGLIHAHPDWAKRHGLILSPWGLDHPLVTGCPPACELDHQEAP